MYIMWLSSLFKIWPIYYHVVCSFDTVLVKFKHCCQYNSPVFDYHPKYNHNWPNYILKKKYGWGSMCHGNKANISQIIKILTCHISLHDVNYEAKWRKKANCKAFKFLHSWKVKVKSLSHVQLFATPWTVAYQATPCMGFSRQENWNGLPFPSPGDLPDPGIEPWSPAL